MPLQLLGKKEFTVRDSDLEGVERGAEDVTYTVRQMSPVRNEQILKQHTHARRHGPEVDRLAVLNDVVDEVLIGWTGIVDVDGSTPVPCTRENKLLMDFSRKTALTNLAVSQHASRAEVRAEGFRQP